MMSCWIGVGTSIIGRRRDLDAESSNVVKSAAEAQRDYDAVCAAGVKAEHRDSDFAVGIKISPSFQIRSRIANLDRPRGRPHFWLNLELGKLKCRDITDASVDETDEWRWTRRTA
jgi:hypothetical protein